MTPRKKWGIINEVDIYPAIIFDAIFLIDLPCESISKIAFFATSVTNGNDCCKQSCKQTHRPTVFRDNQATSVFALFFEGMTLNNPSGSGSVSFHCAVVSTKRDIPAPAQHDVQ